MHPCEPPSEIEDEVVALIAERPRDADTEVESGVGDCHFGHRPF
jgi:hypothetical protein